MIGLRNKGLDILRQRVFALEHLHLHFFPAFEHFVGNDEVALVVGIERGSGSDGFKGSEAGLEDGSGVFEVSWAG